MRGAVDIWNVPSLVSTQVFTYYDSIIVPSLIIYATFICFTCHNKRNFKKERRRENQMKEKEKARWPAGGRRNVSGV